MLHNINDISLSLNISKMTVYRKLNDKELKSHIVIKKGVKYFDDEGLKLLTQKLNNKSSNKSEKAKTDVNDNLPKAEVAADKDNYTISLKSEIDFLRSEIKEKNLQITNLNNRLEAEQDLHKNSQILLKIQQDKPKENILLLESHFKELDIKIIEVMENMEHKKEEYKKKNKTGFLNWFK
jgi:hypothetical protein